MESPEDSELPAVPERSPEAVVERSFEPTWELPEWLTLVALGFVFIGWFLLSTLTSTIGVIAIDFQFFDVAALINEPERLFTGLGNNASWQTIPFGLLCLLVLGGALASRVVDNRWTRLGRLGPLLLMIVCGGLLYRETSQDAFIAALNSKDVTSALVNLANVMAHRSVGVAVKHVSVGAGAWLAGVSALYLSYTGLRR